MTHTNRDFYFTPFTVLCETRSVHVPSLHKSSIASLARRQANAVEFATKVCFLFFAGSEVLMSGTKGPGKLCNVWCFGKLRLA